MKNIFSIIDKVAQTDANILILGENGTGKELIARAIHDRSNRKDEIFVGVDMGSITETLFESELFGHKRGAFTDAKDDRAGRFEIADKGTLFLDEIGNLSMPLQSKLLTVLQRREVTRIGSNKAVPIDIRLICATNMPVHEMVMDNTFRQDLLYRINTVEIFLPPLRERQDDIPTLANHFLKSYSQKYRKDFKGFTTAGLQLLQKYNWPGNIRELQHAIERAIIMAEGDMLDSRDFFFLSAKPTNEKIAATATYNLDEMEKSTIQRAIDKNGGNISKAAKELGLTRASLYRRLEKYGL
jgi:transcriptional regulator with PAS, ATPase and Fis domain